MQRDTYNTVTVSILVPVPNEEADGRVFYDGDFLKVKAFGKEHVHRATLSGKKNWRAIPGWWQRDILDIVALIRALRSNDQLAVQKAILDMKARSYGPASHTLDIVKRLLKEPGYAQEILIHELCPRLDGVRLVLWERQGRVAPGLLCPDVRIGFLVHVLMSAVGARVSLRLCPKCGTTFMQKRADQDYCSVKCREAHRVERWRAKQAESSSKSVFRKQSNQRGKNS
jgi:predicted nucleic acid-binding Zn ribbon protein